MAEHEIVADMLADYALGTLDDEQLGRVAAHLNGCNRCQTELDQMLEMLGLLAIVAPPSPAVRQSILARAQALPTPARNFARESAPRAIAGPTRPRATTRPISGPRDWSQMWQGRPARLALAAVLVAALVSLSVWNVLLQRAADDADEVAVLIANASAAYPLTDSSVVPPASGVLFVDAGSEVGALVAHDLPPLSPDQRYQIWLFTAGGDRVSGGLIDIDREGRARSLVRAPAALDFYAAVGISAEPRTGSLAPTSPLALGGWLR